MNNLIKYIFLTASVISLSGNSYRNKVNQTFYGLITLMHDHHIDTSEDLRTLQSTQDLFQLEQLCQKLYVRLYLKILAEGKKPNIRRALKELLVNPTKQEGNSGGISETAALRMIIQRS